MEPNVRTKRLAAALFLLLAGPIACVRTAPTFRLLPGQPEYLVQSPDRSRTPFDRVLQT